MVDIRARVRKLVQDRGATQAAAALGMEREVVLGVAAGAKVREASLIVAEMRIEAAEAST
jgi:hypothetical protein